MKFEDDLVKVEQGYPGEWHGSFLNYRLLKGFIKTCKKNGCPGDAGDDEDFFEKLSEEMQRVNKWDVRFDIWFVACSMSGCAQASEVNYGPWNSMAISSSYGCSVAHGRTFNQVTLSTLKAYKTIKKDNLAGFCCFLWGSSKVRLPNGRLVHANAENIATLARLCIEYSKVSFWLFVCLESITKDIEGIGDCTHGVWKLSWLLMTLRVFYLINETKLPVVRCGPIAFTGLNSVDG